MQADQSTLRLDLEKVQVLGRGGEVGQSPHREAMEDPTLAGQIPLWGGVGLEPGWPPATSGLNAVGWRR